MNKQIQTALEVGRGVVARSSSPQLESALQRALKANELVPVLSGVYARPEEAKDLRVRARALRLRDPDAVLVKYSAAELQGWTEVPTRQGLQVASLRLRTGGWLTVERRSIPRRWTRHVEGIGTTARALTAVELVDTLGPAPLDDALRRGVPLAELEAAVRALPHRRGVIVRRTWVNRSSTRPFSEAERAAHQTLMDVGVRDWVANRAIYDNAGELVAYGDLVFTHLRLILEIDGEHHLRQPQLGRDRARDRRLARLGWTVVRLPASLPLCDPAGFLDEVLEIVSHRPDLRLLSMKRPG